MVLNISCLSLKKSLGDFLVKWVDWKDGLFSWFFHKKIIYKHTRAYWGLKIDPVDLGERDQIALYVFQVLFLQLFLKAVLYSYHNYLIMINLCGKCLAKWPLTVIKSEDNEE